MRGGPLEIPGGGGGGAKNFQCTNFFSVQVVCSIFFFDVVGLFLDGGPWWTACRIFIFENFPLQEFFLGIVTPPPVISNGLPLIILFLQKSMAIEGGDYTVGVWVWLLNSNKGGIILELQLALV